MLKINEEQKERMLKANERQQKEIETIRDRNIKINLSDADCERLSKKCGEVGMTVSELLQNFVGDLICGTYSNGSDERMHANEWFDRCGFSMFKEDTLLSRLIYWGSDIEDFLVACDEIDYFKENPEDYKVEIEEDGFENLWFNIDYSDYTIEFLSDHPNADMEKEIAICRKWFDDLKSFQGNV